jgi:hypothetical protein
MLLQFERRLRGAFHLKPPYYRMRQRLAAALESGLVQPDWDLEKHWKEVERALGGAGRHWIDHGDLDGEAVHVGVDYDSIRTVQQLLEMLEAIGNRYRPGFYPGRTQRN